MTDIDEIQIFIVTRRVDEKFVMQPKLNYRIAGN